VEAGFDAESRDTEFDGFMEQSSGFGKLSWREAIAEHEHARGSAVTAMEDLLSDLLRGSETESSQG
jgi:hypothetical protein